MASEITSPTRWLALDRESAVTIEAQLSRQIAILIASGQLQLGDRLPPMREVAEHLGVNLLTIRSAYQRLEQQGLVALEQGRGTTVVANGPEQLAGDRRDRRSFTIGVMIPALDEFYRPMLDGLRAALDDPSQILLGDTGQSLERAPVYLRQLVARDVDGLILVSQSMDEFATFDRSKLPPVVFGDWPGSPAPSVVFGLDAVTDAMGHLVADGHETIGFLSPGTGFPTASAMQDAFIAGGAASGLDKQQLPIFYAESWLVGAAERAMAGVLSSPSRPSALVTASAYMAIGARRHLAQVGMSVPNDIGLVAIGGGVNTATVLDPPLTTVDLPAYEMGLQLMTLLQQQLAGEEPASDLVRLESAFNVRASCGTHH
ncbi:MAG: substrate-binding domain-containing protein [Acidimicrobiia bacterium]|nr:substrate-binding domain-containing protein [Acidimicrobiia bacterium]